MEIKCVIIDDEPLAIEVLRQYLKGFPDLTLVQGFDDAITGRVYLQNNPVDLLFIDVDMPDVKGTDLVRSLLQKPLIIFTTAYKSYALDGFELDAVDYLLKPIAQERFQKAVQKAIELFHLKNQLRPETEALFVRSGYQLLKINFSDIEYIESMEDYLKIHLSEGWPVMTLMTMKAVLDKLPPARFIRIHRSYIVALAKIKSIVNRRVTLPSVELPVSFSYLDAVKAWTNQ